MSLAEGLTRMPFSWASATISSEGLGSDQADSPGSDADAQPALQHRTAHLAGADQHERLRKRGR